jgi:hypothetical protein
MQGRNPGTCHDARQECFLFRRGHPLGGGVGPGEAGEQLAAPLAAQGVKGGLACEKPAGRELVDALVQFLGHPGLAEEQVGERGVVDRVRPSRCEVPRLVKQVKSTSVITVPAGLPGVLVQSAGLWRDIVRADDLPAHRPRVSLEVPCRELASVGVPEHQPLCH